MELSNHKCNELRKFLGNVKQTTYVISKENSSWYLAITEFARPETVTMGEADFVGQQMSGYEFAIKFCPFCGEQLK